MRRSRRSMLGLVAGIGLSLSGCAGEPEPLSPTAQRLHEAVTRAYDREGAAVAEEVGFSAVDLGDEFGWSVVADFRIENGSADVGTVRTRFNRTAILVFEELYDTDVRLSDPTVRAFIMWDDPKDLSEKKKEQQFARVTVSEDTAAETNFASLDPSRLPDIADGYAFHRRYVTGERRTTTA